MTLRRRIIVLVVAVLAVTMAAFAWFLVGTARAQFTAQIASRVSTAEQRDRLNAAATNAPLSGSAGQPNPSPLPAQRLLPSRSTDPNGRQTATLLYGASGAQLLADPSGFAGDPDPLPRLPKIGSPAQLAMVDRLVTVPSVDDTMRYLVMTRTVAGGTVRFDAGSLAGVDRAIGRLRRLALLFGSIGVVIASALTALVVRRSFRPVDAMVATAGLIAAGDLSARVPAADPDTELGRLGGSLNAMLGTIEAANHERDEKERVLRQFVADASHELRTPLSSVLGYVELYRAGALQAPNELGRAMDHIDGQAQRMTRLVDDLLLLAKLDRNDFLRREVVDLVAVVKTIGAEFEVLHPEFPLVVELPDVAEAEIDVDRFRQVVDNLLVNVRVHTVPSTKVELAVVVDGSDVVLRVADNGPGIASPDRTRVFERFWRADNSRGRKSGGSGLGLAIVSSIATAHGGAVSIEDRSGGGTSVVVRLPRYVRPGAGSTSASTNLA